MKKLFLLLLFIGNYFAATAYRVEYGGNITITKAVHEDLYIAGGNIIINAPIYGDLIIAGGTVTINDTVTNDILLAGGTVTFNGFVADDIRCAGGNIRISKNVAGDVVIAGGNVVIDKGVVIGGLLASGGNITIDGNVDGEVRGAFGELFLNGTVARNIDCRGGRITVNGNISGKAVLAAKNIVIGNNASFNNEVRYWSRDKSIDFKQSARNVKPIKDPSLKISTGEWYYLGAITVLGMMLYLGMALLMIFIVAYLFAHSLEKAANTIFTDSLKSLGVGFLYFIVVPVAAVIAFITIIGIPVGLLLTFTYVILLLLATIITSIVAANWFNLRNKHNWNYWRLCLASFGIFILLKLLSTIPIAGWLLVFALICIAFGGVLLNIDWKRKPHE